MFAAALGIGLQDADWLRSRLHEAAFGEAQVVRETQWGVVYSIDFELEFREKTASVRSGWIVRPDENFPRLTTCFVTKVPGKQK